MDVRGSRKDVGETDGRERRGRRREGIDGKQRSKVDAWDGSRREAGGWEVHATIVGVMEEGTRPVTSQQSCEVLGRTHDGPFPERMLTERENPGEIHDRGDPRLDGQAGQHP